MTPSASLLVSLMLIVAAIGNVKALVTWISFAGNVIGQSPCPGPAVHGGMTRNWLGIYKHAFLRDPEWGIEPIERFVHYLKFSCGPVAAS